MECEVRVQFSCVLVARALVGLHIRTGRKATSFLPSYGATAEVLPDPQSLRWRGIDLLAPWYASLSA